MGARGYVVRGLYKGRHAGISDLQGSSAGPREPHPFTTLDYAAERAIELRRFDWTDVAIFRVRDDGAEERLPSYEEALTSLQTVSDVLAAFGVPADGTALPQRLQLLHEGAHADPLAALEAAERRLLEAGGWREDSPGWWNDGLTGVSTISTERRSVALTIERRRLAAKGGA